MHSPLFKYLTEAQKFKGFEPDSPSTEMLTNALKSHFPEYLEGDSIKWNFTKFLVNREGQPVGRFEPTASPVSMETEIEKLLAE